MIDNIVVDKLLRIVSINTPIPLNYNNLAVVQNIDNKIKSFLINNYSNLK